MKLVQVKTIRLVQTETVYEKFNAENTIQNIYLLGFTCIDVDGEERPQRYFV
jgi:hypothetical protein